MSTPDPETPTEDARARRLHRSETDRMWWGVCGGLAEYLAVDPALVRVGFVVATLWGGVGLVLYIALAVILPVEARAPGSAPAISAERSHAVAGTVLLVLGALLLAANMGWAPWLSWNLFWPAVLILVGAGLLLRNPHSSASSA